MDWAYEVWDQLLILYLPLNELDYINFTSFRYHKNISVSSHPKAIINVYDEERSCELHE